MEIPDMTTQVQVDVSQVQLTFLLNFFKDDTNEGILWIRFEEEMSCCRVRNKAFFFSIIIYLFCPYFWLMITMIIFATF